MPTSECRRGNCLSCVATVVSGAPFSLRVSDSTALCRLAKEAQLVPLCSAFVTGPNLSMDLDGGPSKAWDLPGALVDSPAPPTLLRQRPVSQPAACLPGHNAPEGVRTMEGLGFGRRLRPRGLAAALRSRDGDLIWILRCDLEMLIWRRAFRTLQAVPRAVRLGPGPRGTGYLPLPLAVGGLLEHR